MLKRLDNIGIAVRDLPRAHDFYTRVLGFDGAPLQDGATGFSAQLGGVALFVFTTDQANSPGRTTEYQRNPVGIDHLAFEVDDFDGAQRELEARGVTWAQDVIGEPGGFRYRGFEDPDGNMLYVIERGT